MMMMLAMKMLIGRVDRVEHEKFYVILNAETCPNISDNIFNLNVNITIYDILYVWIVVCG